MKLDTMSLLLALGVVCSSLSITILLAWRILLPRRCLLIWGCAVGSYAASAFLLLSRGVLPDFFTMIVANICSVGCYALTWSGICLYRGVRIPVRWISGLMVLFVVPYSYFVYADPDIAIRTIIIRIFILIMLSGTIATLFSTRGRRNWRVERCVIGAFLVDMCLRSYILYFQVSHISDKEPLFKNYSASISSIFSIIGLMLWGVAVILMVLDDVVHNLKLEKEERERSADELHLVQSQLLQQDKLATIGQLAAGVAHEINNPVGFIYSNLATLEKYLEKFNKYINMLEMAVCNEGQTALPEEIVALRSALKMDYITRDVGQLLAESRDGAERVKKIVQDLKIFSRVDNTAVGSADLNQCLESTINIVWNEIKYVAELRRDYGDIPHVVCNAQQLNQVFLNLLINSVHAVQNAGREQGEIIVRTSYADNQVVITVADNGCGIEPELSERIFQPFFTTKEIGAGTGLGLSISAEIIHRHGGKISLDSEVGVGTTFSIAIPVKSSDSY